MGSLFSVAKKTEGPDQTSSDVAMADQRSILHIDNLVEVLRMTTPRDVKRLALVDKEFLETSTSNAVWSKFLPPNWELSVHHDRIRGISSTSAMEIYDKLCEGVPEAGNPEMIYSVERETGYLTRWISARAMHIARGNIPSQCQWKEGKSKRFKLIPEVGWMCWLEVRGKFSGRWKPGKYTVSFRLSHALYYNTLLGYWLYLTECYKPFKFTLTVDDVVVKESAAYLTRPNVQPGSGLALAPARKVDDGWIEFNIGEFTVQDAERLVSVEFAMTETERHHKRFILLEGVVIRQIEDLVI